MNIQMWLAKSICPIFYLNICPDAYIPYLKLRRNTKNGRNRKRNGPTGNREGHGQKVELENGPGIRKTKKQITYQSLNGLLVESQLG